MSKYKSAWRGGVPAVAVTVALLLTSIAISAPKTQSDASSDSQRASNARYEKAVQPAEALMADWDFTAAKAALAKLSFKERALADRLIVRRDEVMRLAKLKGEIISRARSGIKLGGAVIETGGKSIFIGEKVTKADDKGLTIVKSTIRASSSRQETWAGLNKASAKKLLKAVVAGDNSEDQIAAGILCTVQRDSVSAANYFRKAKSLGADTEMYLSPLAAAMFANAQKLLDGKQYAKAQKVLDILDKEYSNTPWCVSYKHDIAHARMIVGSEPLYAEAAALFKKGELDGSLPGIVKRLKAEFSTSPAVTDNSRDPSFARMAEAVKDIKPPTIVRKDGKGDFRSIQAAIDAAKPGSVIEIQDAGPYNEKIKFSKNKAGLTLRGKKGLWPIVHSVKGGAKIGSLVLVETKDITLEGLVLAHLSPSGGTPRCVAVGTGSSLLVRSSVLSMHGAEGVWVSQKHSGQPRIVIEDSFIAADASGESDHFTVRNSIWVGTKMGMRKSDIANCVLLVDSVKAHGLFRHCTIVGKVDLSGTNVIDSIILNVRIHSNQIIRRCNIYGETPKDIKSTTKVIFKECFVKDPMFVNPKKLDYSLKSRSPCRRKATDGEDIGVQFTPKMIEIRKKAFELLAKKIIRF
ncbi:MAG: hypothetical protein QGH60_12765 [Phycisphaerae bacterium]|nr:hypothetical protein [Phycisphaerae bacterium]